MREGDKQFLDIMSSAIRGEKFRCDKCKSTDWSWILEQSREHNVTALIYYSLDNNSKSIIDKSIVEEFKRDTILSGVYQIKSDMQIKKILMEFNKNELTPIVLKGPILKELYPLSELRTMSDLDLLINTTEYKKAQIIMEQIGYKKFKGEGGHIEYVKKGAISVELHLAHHFKGKREEEDVFWKNCMIFSILNTDTRMLSLEDNLVYLCIHMAKHLLLFGIGVRQLCDFTLFIEKNAHLINWDKFIEKVNIYDLKNFFFIMVEICNRSLNLYVPDEIGDMLTTDKNNYEKLIVYILDGGVFGKKHLSILEGISDKYEYCKKYKVLLIFAWIREIITFLKDKESVVSLLKAPFIVFICNIKRKRICREIYL